MSNVGKAIFARLQATAAVTAIVGVKVMPFDVFQGNALPAVTYHVVTQPRINALGGHSGLYKALVQVDCWAETYDVCQLLSEAVRVSLQDFSGTAGGVIVRDLLMESDSDNEIEPFDGSQVSTFRRMHEYTAWLRES